MKTKPRFIVEPVVDCDPDVGRWLAILDDARKRTQFTFSQIKSEELDAPPVTGINTIGTLLYHIALSDLNWVFDNMLQQPYPKHVATLFPFPQLNSIGHLSPISGWNVADYQNRLDAARQCIRDVFKPMTVSEFRQLLQRVESYGE